MGISRVQKFKEYRNSMIKEDCPVLETPEKEEKASRQYEEEHKENGNAQ